MCHAVVQIPAMLVCTLGANCISSRINGVGGRKLGLPHFTVPTALPQGAPLVPSPGAGFGVCTHKPQHRGCVNLFPRPPWVR